MRPFQNQSEETNKVDDDQSNNNHTETQSSDGSENDSTCSSSNTHQSNIKEVAVEEASGSDVVVVTEEAEALPDDCGRERLKRLRVEVAGRVWIPDMWGQEELLKGWIDCSVFDASLMPKRIMSARAALVQEGRRPNSARLRIENRC